MVFELTEQQRLIRNRCRAFLEREIVPLVAERERERRTLAKDILKTLDAFHFTGEASPCTGRGQDAPRLSRRA